MIRTLLTGFRAFGKVRENPSESIVTALGPFSVKGHRLTRRILPVSYARSSVLLSRLLLRGRFHLAVLLGVAAGSEAIRLERYAHNCVDVEKPDVDGWKPRDRRILLDVPERFATRVDVRRIVKVLAQSEIGVTTSENAGDYVCNHAYFHALHTIDRNSLPTKCVFVHVPAHLVNIDDVFTIPLDRQIETIIRIIGAACRTGD